MSPLKNQTLIYSRGLIVIGGDPFLISINLSDDPIVKIDVRKSCDNFDAELSSLDRVFPQDLFLLSWDEKNPTSLTCDNLRPLHSVTSEV